MEILLLIGMIFGIMYVMGWALQDDLKRMEDSDPKYRKHLKDKYGW